MGLISTLKDAAIGATVRQFLSSKLEGYGKILHLDIDTKNRQIDLKFQLEGEEHPVHVTLRGFEFTEIAGTTHISASEGAFTSSRLWLTKLLNAQVAGRSFAIPDKYAKYAKGLIG